MKLSAVGPLCLLAFLCMEALASGCGASAGEVGKTLRNELQGLAERYDFAIVGADKLRDSVASTQVDGDVAEQLQSVLRNYSYILTYDTAGAIRQVQIISQSPTTEELERRVTTKTSRRGESHLLDAIVVGPTGASRKFSFVVDTGASTIVLPSSAIEELGFRPHDLKNGWSQTAGGPVDVKLGTLASVQVGQNSLEDVTVAFIEDKKLGDQKLLGMSFLSEFRLTFDNDSDQILLAPR